MRKHIFVLCAFVAIVAHAAARPAQGQGSVSGRWSALVGEGATGTPANGFEERFGAGWSVYRHPGETAPSLITGPGFPAGGPVRADDEGVARARDLLEQLADVLGVEDPSAFTLERCVAAPNANGQEIVTVLFRQHLGGLEVWRESDDGELLRPADVKFLFNGTLGRVVLLGSDAVPAEPEPGPAQMTELRALEVSLGRLGAAAASLKDVRVRSYVSVRRDRRFIAREVEVATSEPVARTRFVFDAGNGRLEQELDTLERADVTGNVSAGSWDFPGGAFAVRPAADLYVSVSGGESRFTDGSGNFSIPTPGSSPVMVFGRFDGRWVRVTDQGGNGDLSFSRTATPGTPVNVVLNPGSGAEAESAEAAAFHWGTQAALFLKRYVPNLDMGPIPINVNRRGTECFNTFDGVSINLSPSGWTCPNFAYSDRVAHEYAHAFHHWFQGPRHSHGFSHGIGDHIALYFTDQRWFGRGSPLGTHRDYRYGWPQGWADGLWPCARMMGNNEMVYYCGSIWAGFALDLKDYLIQRHGAPAGKLRAEQITISQFLSNPFDHIAGVAYVYVYDDDDGNLGNGTPNCPQISQAAYRHNLPVPHDLPASCGRRLAAPYGGTNQRASLSSARAPANATSGLAGVALSADGRFVAFDSNASNLVPGDGNGRTDVLVRDRVDGLTTRVSVSSTGTEGNGNSDSPSISWNARLVAFRSAANNLVAGDTNNQDDVFVHDRLTGSTTRVSVGAGGAQANGPSRTPVLSGDGQLVAFVSGATNLVTGDSNGRDDVFVSELSTGIVTRVSVATSGAQANNASSFPALSFDGRIVAFTSLANNLASGDTNAWEDVFTRDRATGTTTRVSVGPGGVQGNGASGHTGVSVNFDGSRIAFASGATNFASPDTNSVDDVFVRDTVNARTLRATLNSNQDEANGTSGTPAISADGRIVAFWSDSNDLLPFIDNNNVIDVWIRDMLTDTTVIVSADPSVVVGNAVSREPLAISANGRVVAYRSLAQNLVESDTNGVADVFARELLPALWTVDHIYPNWQIGLYLYAPGEHHQSYVMGLSWGYRPGIPVDERSIPLVNDPLLLWSITDAGRFSHFVGHFDEVGQGIGYIAMPDDQRLVGRGFYAAFVTLDPGSRSGIRGISNALKLTVTTPP